MRKPASCRQHHLSPGGQGDHDPPAAFLPPEQGTGDERSQHDPCPLDKIRWSIQVDQSTSHGPQPGQADHPDQSHAAPSVPAGQSGRPPHPHWQCLR